MGDPPPLLFPETTARKCQSTNRTSWCAAYGKAKIPVQFEVVYGAGHGGTAFYGAKRWAIVKEYLRRHF